MALLRRFCTLAIKYRKVPKGNLCVGDTVKIPILRYNKVQTVHVKLNKKVIERKKTGCSTYSRNYFNGTVLNKELETTEENIRVPVGDINFYPYDFNIHTGSIFSEMKHYFEVIT